MNWVIFGMHLIDLAWIEDSVMEKASYSCFLGHDRACSLSTQILLLNGKNAMPLFDGTFI